jgi:hypothetical protein
VCRVESEFRLIQAFGRAALILLNLPIVRPTSLHVVGWLNGRGLIVILNGVIEALIQYLKGMNWKPTAAMPMQEVLIVLVGGLNHCASLQKVFDNSCR